MFVQNGTLGKNYYDGYLLESLLIICLHVGLFLINLSLLYLIDSVDFLFG